MFTLPAYLYRGGTSKCWLFAAADVAPFAPDQLALSHLLSAALGG
jgi:2-methylaconitate cis-trans-isomerase PrpF